MNIKLSVVRGSMSMSTAAKHTGQNLRGASYLARTYKRSYSETLPAHLRSVLGSHDPGQMGITTWSESVQPLQSVNPDISAVLMVTSNPDSHMIRI